VGKQTFYFGRLAIFLQNYLQTQISSEIKIVLFAAEKLGFTFVESNVTQRIAEFRMK
jgi:hypothetical protein